MTRLEIFEKVHERLDANSHSIYLCNEIGFMLQTREITRTEHDRALKFLRANRPTSRRFKKYYDYKYYAKKPCRESWWNIGGDVRAIEVIEEKKAFVYELIRKLRYKKLKG